MNLAQVRRARRRLRAPLAAGHRARVRPLDRRRRRGRAARGGGGRRRPPARRPGDGDARRQGARVRPRLRARPDRPRACRARAGARSSRSPTRCSRRRCRPDTKAAHVAEMRRLLHVAMTRARTRLVLAYPERHRARRAPARRRRSPRRRAPRVGGEWEAREEELFGPAETLQSTFRMLRDELLDHGRAGRRAARRAALRHRPRRLARRRALPRAAQARRADRARARGPGGRRGAARGQRARSLQAATAEQREIFETSRARRVPARRRARRGAARARGRARARAVAGAVPARAAATG